jgi:hypothetical protein
LANSSIAFIKSIYFHSFIYKIWKLENYYIKYIYIGYENIFNENKLKELDIEYLENCFIDFVDLPNTYTDEKDKGYWHIQIFFPHLDKGIQHGSKFNIENLDGVIKHNDEIGEVYKDIDTSIKRLR